MYAKVLAAFLAIGLLAAGATSVGADPGPHPDFVQQQQSAQELRQLGGKDLEIGYINRIIPHHQGAIEMAQIIQAQTTRPELRADAAQIIKDQQQEIADLTAYLKQAYNQAVTPDRRFVMGDDMMQMLRDADPMMAEQMFLLMMREHHQSAIDLGTIVLAKPVATPIKDQATKMIASQRQEQAKFAGYLKTWYGIDAPTPTGDMRAAMELVMGMGTMPGLPNTGAGGARTSPAPAVPALAALLALALLALPVARRLARR